MKFRKPKLGLGTRLALTTALIILAVLMVDVISRIIVPEPDVILMDQQWLADNIAAAQAKLDAAAQADRPAILGALPSHDILEFRIAPEREQFRHREQSAEGDALTAFLRPYLRPGSELTVTVKDFSLSFEHALSSIAVVVTRMPVRHVDADDNVLVTPFLNIQVSLADGTWLSVSQSRDDSMWLRLLRNLGAPLFGILSILLISYWGARRLLGPLRQLSVAAEKMGRERSVTVIPEMKIPEYKAIADSFNDMQLRLKRFVDDRTQMLAAISHDLGTPLTRMRLLAEDMSDPAQRDQVLADIADMEMMIQTSLLFARDDAQAEGYVTVDLASLAISLCDNATDAGQVAAYHGPDHAPLPCRPTAMRRALTNLIDNGCKYGGSVVVSLGNDADTFVITVSDQGPGIPAEDIETAFKPFRRLETSRNRATGGAGLGLTIARDIIHGHGGSLTLQNNSGPGLTATIRLPKPAG
jgi:signal transduction histidine kinase